MATVTGFTAERMLEIENETVVSGLVDVNGDLLLYTREGTEINAGYVKGDPGDDATVPDASTTVKGKAELSTDAENITGTDTVRTTTPKSTKAAFDSWNANDVSRLDAHDLIVNVMGSKVIKPASVTVSGGGSSGSVASSGRVSFSTATQLILPGVLTGRRRVRLVFIPSAAGDYCHLRFGNGGTPNVTGIYNWQQFGAQLGAFYYGAGFYGASGSSIRLTPMMADVYILGAGLATRTDVYGLGRWGGTSPTGFVISGSIDNSTTYSDIVLLPGTGTMTGELILYEEMDAV